MAQPLILALALRWQRQADKISEFKVSLVYRASLMTARAIQSNPVSKKQNKKHLLFLQMMFGSQDPHLVSHNQGGLAHYVADAREMRCYAS